MKNEPCLISVVIPIYQVEKYLAKCIDSVLSQTYTNLEILLVDDGSIDRCSEICDTYAKRDNRIQVYHKPNGGLSDARNFGIDKATGEYICFIDSDDFVSEFYVEKLLEAAQHNHADIAACNFEYIDEEGKTWTRKEKKETVYSSIEAIKDIFTFTQNTEVMVWNKLYKRSLFVDNDIKFPKGRIHEDNFTTYRLYDKANKIVLIHDKLYYYLQRNNSIMSTFNKKRFDILLALDEIRKYFKDRKELDEAITYNELSIYLSLINLMIKTNYTGEEKTEIRNRILNDKNKYLKNTYMSFKKKMMVIILSINMKLYSKIFLALTK